MNILAVYRAERFSPNSVDRDMAIMDELRRRVGGCPAVREEQLAISQREVDAADIIITMARGREALDILASAEAHALVVNSASAIAKCSRSAVDRLMRDNNIPAAPLYSSGAWWIKRGDQAAQDKGDVRYAADDGEKKRILEDFRRRGVSDVVTTAHVEGDLLKFYGVAGTDFFSTAYPAENGYSKFGDESINGAVCHYNYDRHTLWRNADTLARLIGVSVYGGDCIVRKDGSLAIIDFNDWPSFSTCRIEAADAIAELILRK